MVESKRMVVQLRNYIQSLQTCDPRSLEYVEEEENASMTLLTGFVKVDQSCLNFDC